MPGVWYNITYKETEKGSDSEGKAAKPNDTQDISVRSRSDADGLHFAALHEDGTLASVALFQSAART